MKHTKGPWRVEGQDIFGDDKNGYICSWSGNSKDASLIAAAPELLEACHKAYCKLVELEVDAERSLYISDELNALEQAILKSKGE